MKRDLHKLLDAARSRRWSVDLTSGNHWKLRHASGAIVFIAGTPSDRRALRNAEVTLRRVERQSTTAAGSAPA